MDLDLRGRGEFGRVARLPGGRLPRGAPSFSAFAVPVAPGSEGLKAMSLGEKAAQLVKADEVDLTKTVVNPAPTAEEK